MADHNEDLLDDDGLEPAFELDLADEDALLADDYDEISLSNQPPLHRKVIERPPEDEDFIDIGIEEDIPEENGENGNRALEEGNDSDGEVKERSRFKTERNIIQTPARTNKPIPETLDVVPVKTVVHSVRSRYGPNPLMNRRGRDVNFRGQGRGFFPHHHFTPHHNFNNYQNNFYPPPHQQYGAPPPPQPPSIQQLHPPPYQPPQHGPPPAPVYQQQSQVQQPIQQQYYNNLQTEQQPPPPRPLIPPPVQGTSAPGIPAGQKIHVNPHFKNNLGNLWNGINNTWSNSSNSTSQNNQPPSEQYGTQQNTWSEGTSQDYYYNNQGSDQTRNEYNDGQYYPAEGADPYYQPNNEIQHTYSHPPPSTPQPLSQVPNTWDENSANYYPPEGVNQYGETPEPHVANHVTQGPPPTTPNSYGSPMGPPPITGPPPGPSPNINPHMGPPPPLGPRLGHHNPRPFIRPMGGRPPLMRPSRGGMFVNPNIMGNPRKMMRMQQYPQQPFPNTGGHVRMRLNMNRPNFNISKHNVSPNIVLRNNEMKNRTPGLVWPKTTRTDNIKKIKLVVPSKLQEASPSTQATPEDEDEETKAYRRKIEEQKKLREDVVRMKEERRKVAAQQKQQLSDDGSTTNPPAAETRQNEIGDPMTTFKTVRIMQSDGTTVLRKLTLAQIAKLKKITPSTNSATKETPAKPEEPASKVVSVENLSASTSYRQLMDMARAVGVVETVTLNTDGKKSIIKFMKVEDAQSFVRRNHRKMVDLSMIQVKIVPENNNPPTSAKEPSA